MNIITVLTETLDDPVCNGIAVLAVLVFAFLQIRPRGQMTRADRKAVRNHKNIPTEQGYRIRRQCDGYTFSVGAMAFRRAMATREYDYLGKDTGPSLRYTGSDQAGGHFNGTIPAGHILTDRIYQDERLN